MSKLRQNDLFSWYETLQDAREDGYAPTPVLSLLAFFILQGKTTVICKENLAPIPALQYAYHGLRPDGQKVFFVKDYRGYSVDELYFCRTEWKKEADDEALNIFRRRCRDGLVYLLMTKEQGEDLSAMSKRLYRANFKEEGKLPYKLWLAIAEKSIDLEDYKSYGANLTGYKTVCKIFETEIEELWDKAKK